MTYFLTIGALITLGIVAPWGALEWFYIAVVVAVPLIAVLDEARKQKKAPTTHEGGGGLS